MKPNAAELCALMNKCITNEKLSISNRSQITKVLSKYSNTESQSLYENKNVQDVISDMRVLGTGLLNIMNSKPNRPAQEFRKANRRVIGKHVLVSMGKYGVIWLGPPSMIGKDADVNISDYISSKYIPPLVVLEKEIVNTSGAGDSFCAGLIHSLLPGQGTGPTLESIYAGMRYAEQSLQSMSAVPK
jgi:fructose-1-phosphate kinase PfkB-like protein